MKIALRSSQYTLPESLENCRVYLGSARSAEAETPLHLKVSLIIYQRNLEELSDTLYARFITLAAILRQNMRFDIHVILSRDGAIHDVLRRREVTSFFNTEKEAVDFVYSSAVGENNLVLFFNYLDPYLPSAYKDKLTATNIWIDNENCTQLNLTLPSVQLYTIIKNITQLNAKVTLPILTKRTITLPFVSKSIDQKFVVIVNRDLEEELPGAFEYGEALNEEEEKEVANILKADRVRSINADEHEKSKVLTQSSVIWLKARNAIRIEGSL